MTERAGTGCITDGELTIGLVFFFIILVVAYFSGFLYLIWPPIEEAPPEPGCTVCSCESPLLIKFQVFITPDLQSPLIEPGSGFTVNATWCGGAVQNITGEDGVTIIPMYWSKAYHILIHNESMREELDLYPRDNYYRVMITGKEDMIS